MMRHDCGWLAWAMLIAGMLISTIVRVRLLNVPFERDEGEFAYMGQLMLQGIPPYKLASNMKMPGIYAAYALIMAVFGQSVAGVHFGFLLANLANIALVFVLTRRFLGSIAAGAAAIVFAVLTTNSGIVGTSAHATHLVTLFALGGFLLVFRALESGWWITYLASGLMFGTSFLMKQPGGAFGILAFLWAVWDAYRRKIRWNQAAISLLALTLGGVLPLAITVVLLWNAGVLGNFYFWTVTYCREYATQVPISSAFRSFYLNAKEVARHTWPLYALGVLGLAAVIADNKLRRASGFLAWFWLFSFIALCPGFYFRWHYFVVVTAAVAMTCGAAVYWAWECISARGSVANWRFLPVVVLGAAVIYPVYADREYLFVASPAKACRLMYDGNPFPESVGIAKRIARDTTPEDKIAIFGSEPQIFFYSRRRSATSYIYMYPLMELHPYARAMQRRFVREVERGKPKYLVVVSIPMSWLGRPESEHLVLDWLLANVDRLYKPVGIIDIFSNTTLEYWGRNAFGVRPSSKVYVTVYKRRGI